jgi:hypothetical protein
MIDKQEIDAKAEELGVHAANVQRDYHDKPQQVPRLP